MLTRLLYPIRWTEYQPSYPDSKIGIDDCVYCITIYSIMRLWYNQILQQSSISMLSWSTNEQHHIPFFDLTSLLIRQSMENRLWELSDFSKQFFLTPFWNKYNVILQILNSNDLNFHKTSFILLCAYYPSSPKEDFYNWILMSNIESLTIQTCGLSIPYLKKSLYCRQKHNTHHLFFLTPCKF